jgi:Trk K+ transport system NAD-binding subunit
MSLAHLKIEPESRFNNQTVSDVEQKYKLSVVYIRRNSLSDFHPPAEYRLSAQDELAVLGGLNEIRILAIDNHPSS